MVVSCGWRTAGVGLTHIARPCDGGNWYGVDALESDDAVETHPGALESLSRHRVITDRDGPAVQHIFREHAVVWCFGVPGVSPGGPPGTRPSIRACGGSPWHEARRYQRDR